MAGTEEERIEALQGEVRALGRELYRRCMASHDGGLQGGGVGRFGLPAPRYDGSRQYRVDIRKDIEGPGFDYVEPEGYEGPGVPDEYCCKITLHIMTDPVLASDGVWYEACALQRWYCAEGKRVGVYRQPLDHFCFRVSEMQDVIDRWAKEIGDTAPQLVGGRSLQGAEKRSWMVRRAWARLLPERSLCEEVKRIFDVIKGFRAVLASYVGEFGALAREFQDRGVIGAEEADASAYAEVLQEAYDMIEGEGYYTGLEGLIHLRVSGLNLAGMGYSRTRSGRIATAWQLLRLYTLVRHTMSHRTASRTDVWVATHPAESAVGFVGVVHLHNVQPSAMLVEELVSLGLDPSLPWDLGPGTGTRDVLEKLRAQVQRLKDCMASIRGALEGTMDSALEGTVHNIRVQAARVLAVGTAKRILRDAWFVRDGADFDRPLAPPKAPLAYEAPRHVLEMWPTYPADRYRYMKTLFIVDSLGELATSQVDLCNAPELPEIDRYDRSPGFTGWELRALRMADVGTGPLSALEGVQAPH